MLIFPPGLMGRISSVDTHVLCLVTQSCPTLYNPMDYSPPGFSVHGDSPGKNTGVGCHACLQGIFPTQGLNPGLPHCRRILYHLRYKFINRRVKYHELAETNRVMIIGKEKTFDKH